MNGKLLAVCGLALAACSPPAATGDAAANNDPAAAAPTYSYKCGDAAYKLVIDFDRLEATPASGAPISLRALFPMSAEGVATYTDGKISFFVKNGQEQGKGQPEVSFARGKMAPVACTPG